MTLLTTVNDVNAVVGVHQMSAIFTNLAADRTAFEMLALANEMARRIATDLRDWTELRVQATLTGDGVNEAFSLPANYRRMLTSGNVWRSTTTMYPMRFIPDTDQWFQRRAANYSDPRGEWTIFGGKMHIWPIMGGPVTGPPAVAAVKATFPYLDKNSVVLASPPAAVPGTFGEQFASDNDTFRLDERLLKLGMIYQWKANKGSPYAEDMGNYQDAMSMAMGANSPSPIIIGRLPASAAVGSSYPFPIPDGMTPI